MGIKLKALNGMGVKINEADGNVHENETSRLKCNGNESEWKSMKGGWTNEYLERNWMLTMAQTWWW